MCIHAMMSLYPQKMGLGIVGGILPQYDNRGCLINTSVQSDVFSLIDHIINQKSQFDESLRKKYFFVIEACEYKEHIRLYDIDYLLIISVDRDHRDYFVTESSYTQVFVDACKQTRYTCFASDQAYTCVSPLYPALHQTAIHSFDSMYLVGSFHPTNAGMIYTLLHHMQLFVDPVQFDAALATYR